MQQSAQKQKVMQLFVENQQFLQQQFAILSHDALQQALTQAQLARQSHRQAVLYFLQQQADSEQLSYFFSPLILSALKQKVVYSCRHSAVLDHSLAQYFRLAALDLAHKQTLQDLDICFDLYPETHSMQRLNEEVLLKALLDAESSAVVLLGAVLDEDLVECLKHYHLPIHIVDLLPQAFDLKEIDFKKLFWKRKTEHTAEICQMMSTANAPLLSQLLNLKANDAYRLIDDLMYGEHLFEKVSVLGEFSETIFKQHESR